MRRTPLRAAVAAVALVLGAPAVAHANTIGGTSVVLQPLRLTCVPRVTTDAAAVHCTWSLPTSERAAGLRLWRLEPGADDHRRVIFRTDDTTITSHVDEAVRREHRYLYSIQAVDAAGRVIAQSRTESVYVPAQPPPNVEVLRLHCALARAHEAVACEWSPPTSRRASVVELWRSFDGAVRERVARFEPRGANAYRDPVPDGASRIVYAVVAKDDAGRIVGRSRAQVVRIPDVAPTDTRPPATAPSDTVPAATRPSDTHTPANPAPSRPSTTTSTTTTTTTPTTTTTTTVPTPQTAATVPPTTAPTRDRVKP